MTKLDDMISDNDFNSVRPLTEIEADVERYTETSVFDKLSGNTMGYLVNSAWLGIVRTELANAKEYYKRKG
jgi:hypothetical protein